jgi:hypothetical protein
MEMHAVSDLGSYEVICERALMAGNDVILFCSHVERMPDLNRFLDRRCTEDATFRLRFEDALRRAEAYRTHCEKLRASAGAPASWNSIVDEAIRFCQDFEKTRPHREVVVPDSERRKGSRNPGTGRSGREEWT